MPYKQYTVIDGKEFKKEWLIEFEYLSPLERQWFSSSEILIKRDTARRVLRGYRRNEAIGLMRNVHVKKRLVQVNWEATTL